VAHGLIDVFAAQYDYVMLRILFFHFHLISTIQLTSRSSRDRFPLASVGRTPTSAGPEPFHIPAAAIRLPTWPNQRKAHPRNASLDLRPHRPSLQAGTRWQFLSMRMGYHPSAASGWQTVFRKGNRPDKNRTNVRVD
jgi:hypothetical protein